MRVGKQVLENAEAKWIQMSKLTYENNNRQHSWEMVERKHKKSNGVDAIIIAPILSGKGGLKTILALQYRPPIDRISVEFPAGLTDEGELAEETALRELKEETGYMGKVISTSPILSSDPGITNSVFQIVTVQVDLNHPNNQNTKQDLQGDENIELKVVELDTLLDTLGELGKSCCIDGKLYHYAMGLQNTGIPELTQQQIKDFNTKGYLTIPNMLSTAECDALLKHSIELCDDFSPKENKTIFSTEEAKQVKDDYFLDSHDKIRYFVEADATESDLINNKQKCVNKIGHALHCLDPKFKLISDKAIVSNICRQLGMVDPHIMQSMVIFKQPKIGGKVDQHQDGTFLITDKLIAFWIALEDTTIDNGCLQVAPGSHSFPISKFFEKQSDGSMKFNQIHKPEDNLKYENVIIKKGSLILIHGSVYHQSMENKSEKSRIAYTFHVSDLQNGWDTRNWIKKSDASYKLNK